MPEADVAAAAASQGLVARGVTLYRRGRPVLAGIDLALGPGELLQVSGRNGSGKTSLLRVLAGLLSAEDGTLAWRQRPVRGGDAEYQRCIAYVGHADGLTPELDARANLAYAQWLAGEPPDAGAVRAALAAFGLDAVGEAPVRTLSQGQRRRVALARLALVPRPLWLLDEPLTALDADAVACWRGQLAAHLRAGGIAVVATHQASEPDGSVLRLGA